MTPTRIGIIGVNTWHAEAFTDALLGVGPASGLGGPVEDMRIEAIWGEPAQTKADLCRKTGARSATGDPADMIGEIELALIIDDEGGGSRHRELSEPFLRAGVPVFIDKPMALTVADARAVLALATEHDTPVMSGSALRFAAEWEARRSDIERIGEIRTVSACGPGDWYYYGIHAVELMLLAVDSEPSWVRMSSSPEQDVAVVGLADERLATVQVLRGAFYTFSITLYGTEGWLSFDITRNYEFYRRQLTAAIDMARSRRSPVTHDHMMSVIGVLHAGLTSVSRNETVKIAEVLS